MLSTAKVLLSGHRAPGALCYTSAGVQIRIAGHAGACLWFARTHRIQQGH
jgi:hypothetical protein